ncbi:Protein of unknown function DUF4486 [Plasmopara halstedii]|uniref:Fibronectin type-III domain-containing protein n=1 Tax=Plasmopara halstedii TaxID=4781 RepID=A0A0N7L6Z0_PLAHL|nr:Protein of unknown function DUF4486 [Plasmopara halstedii]CEG45611.1 Protein of unknown function DUF4486 [Plasmopara halstedii]|eukprot:XP_024581980.1 Protein of unknown function DUF4486 [Plasmopara halstedii]
MASNATNVVKNQLSRDLTAILQVTREKRGRTASFKSSKDPTSQEVSYYGDVAQQLVALVDQVMRASPEQLSTIDKIDLFVKFGDKFYQCQEYHSASLFFYQNVLKLDIFCHQNGFEHSLNSIETQTKVLSLVEGQAYIRSLYGLAMCSFHAQKRSDELMRYPGSLGRMIEAMTALRRGMEIALDMERQHPDKFSWLTLNGTILIYSIAKPLQTLGFAKEVVVYLKYSLLAMESIEALSTTTYILWRIQLGSTICDCYQDAAVKEEGNANRHNQSAVACALYLQQIVQRLRKEEELDMPLPDNVQQILLQSETASALLLFRLKATAAHQPHTKNAIVSAFSSSHDQLRAAIDAIQAWLRQDRQRRGGQVLSIMKPAVSPPNGTLLELFEFVMTIVTPMLRSFVEVEEATAATKSIMLDVVPFSISFHLITIRTCLQLGQPDEQMNLLTKSAHARLQGTSSELSAANAATIKCVIALYDTLYDVQQSWAKWEALSDEERLQSTLHLRLTISNVTIPSSVLLTRLSNAVQMCVSHGSGAIAWATHDLLTCVALQMWREMGIVLLKELDATDIACLPESLVFLTCDLLLTIHITLIAVKFDDLLLLGHIALCLATLLSIRGEARKGSQVVRKCLDQIDLRRCEVVDFSSHFQSVVDVKSTTYLSGASFSCNLENMNRVDTEAATARDNVGIQGTGSLLGSLHQSLCCLQVDLLMLMYRLELQAAKMIDTASNVSIRHSLLLMTEATLYNECLQNDYMKVLFNIQRLNLPEKSIKKRRKLADECSQLLKKLERQEEKLCRQLAPIAASPASAVPAAPIILSRSSNSIILQVVPYHPSGPSFRTKSVQYYMVFAKSVGSGTNVSLTSNELPGTATPIYPPQTNAKITGLLPNESYVFAVAAFDKNNQVINSIGETSEPVVALNPLPLRMCYGYLALACYDAQLIAGATRAASNLSNTITSNVCAENPPLIASPFNKQSLKREVVVRLPQPILNLCIQALLILCHNESEDHNQEGEDIISSNLDAESLVEIQRVALENSHRISIGVEIACLTDNQEAIRVLCFKGYRLLLPLFRSKGCCNILTFATLVTYYQALKLISEAEWDVDTRKIGARIGFELLRIARELHSDVARIASSLILSTNLETEQASPESKIETTSFQEVLALFQLAANAHEDTPAAGAPLRHVNSNASATSGGIKGKIPTLQNAEEADSMTAQEKIKSLSEIVRLVADNNLSTILKTLQQMSNSDCQALEFACKVAWTLLKTKFQYVTQLGEFLASLRVTPVISTYFRETLTSLGGAFLLPELTDANEAKPSGDLNNEGIKSPESIVNKSAPNDDYMFKWCGELFFIQSVIVYQEIAKRSKSIDNVDVAKGPTGDCVYGYPYVFGKSADQINREEDDETALSPRGQTRRTDSSQDREFLGDTGIADSIDNHLDQLFGTILEKTAACCKLFQLAKCWQGLQAAVRQLWNAICLAWVPPTRVSASPTWQKHFLTCTEALLDMMDSTATTAANQSKTPLSAATSNIFDANALDVDHACVARVVTYSLKALCSSKDWKAIVEIGGRYQLLSSHSIDGSLFSQQNFLVMIFAQKQVMYQHEALLAAAKEEVKALITLNQGQEVIAKESILVEGEDAHQAQAFQAIQREKEQQIQQLTVERDLELKKLTHMNELNDRFTKIINKGQQMLHTCHQMIEQYSRLEHRNDPPNQKELAALRHQIIGLFKRCVASARQKRQKQLICQALQEMGDFYLASGDLKAANKCWLESLDNAFGTLNVCASWRDILISAVDSFTNRNDANKDQFAGNDLWVGIQSCCVLSKLIMHSTGTDMHESINYALMAAAIFTRCYGCPMPLQEKCSLYGSCRMHGFQWPGWKIFSDQDGVSSFSLTIMLMLVPEVLLLYKQQYASTAMPVIKGYEYVAQNCLCDVNHVANARRLQIEALIHCGRFQEAWRFLMELLQGGTTVLENINSSELNTITFHDEKLLVDDRNRAAINWLSTLKVEVIQTELRKHYPMTLVVHILALILHLATAMAKHESRYDRGAAIICSAAKNMAHTLLSLLRPIDVTASQVTESEPNKKGSEDTSSYPLQQSLSWENVQLYRIRADVLLQLSRLSFYEGDWIASKASSMDAIEEFDAISRNHNQPMHLELDQILKFSLLVPRGSFVAECQSQIASCCLAQADYRTAHEVAQIAIEETKKSGEVHVRQQLELQRLQAAVFLGNREQTEQALIALKHDALATHTTTSLTYTRTLLTLSSLLRSKALISGNPSNLKAVDECLSEAEVLLNVLLKHDGWTGVNVSSLQQNEERLNLYRPAVPDLVQVNAELTQVLLEYPLNPEFESVHTRQKRALRLVEAGLRSLEHTTQRMLATKARLLLFKGILISKLLFSTTTEFAESKPRCVDKNIAQRFDECVEAFLSCIKSSIEDGYDRRLVQLALIQLVDIFSRKLVPGDEDTHVQAAFHYLKVAVVVQKHEFVLFNTLELQSGAITSVNNLPASVRAAINAQFDATENSCSARLDENASDTSHIVNYFVRLLRMQRILPIATTELQDTAAFLHRFLMQNHSEYTRVACLANLPPVSSTDPEICTGLVCCIWGHELAPAIATPSTNTTELTLYFALGTTSISISDKQSDVDNEAAVARMKRFGSSLLSKRCNLDRQSVKHVKAALSNLRTQMEDLDSLLIDRTSFQHLFHSILCKIQQLFRGAGYSPNLSLQGRAETMVEASACTQRDGFGDKISIECTLETVRRFEDMFSINKGANFVDNDLCFFSRDLLD